MSDMFSLTRDELRKVTSPTSLKVAIVSVFRNPATETAGSMMTEMKTWTEKDFEDFRRIFKAELGWDLPPAVKIG